MSSFRNPQPWWRGCTPDTGGESLLLSPLVTQPLRASASMQISQVQLHQHGQDGALLHLRLLPLRNARGQLRVRHHQVQ